MTPRTYYESKKTIYSMVLILLCALLILSFYYASPIDPFFGSLILIVCAMLLGIYLYPSATISLYDDHLEFKKGLQEISVPWTDVVGIHKDPVFAKNIISYYIAKRFYMGGFFLQTTLGYSKYFAPQLIRSKESSLTWKDLVKDIESCSTAQVQEGAVSMFKQKSKLFDVVFLPLAIFVVPILLILLYGIFTGTLGESVVILKDLFGLLTGK